MNKKIRNTIIQLASFVLDDVEFKKLMSYIDLNLFNNARLFIEEKVEYLETILSLDISNNVINFQLEKCVELDNILTDIYVNN